MDSINLSPVHTLTQTSANIGQQSQAVQGQNIAHSTQLVDLESPKKIVGRMINGVDFAEDLSAQYLITKYMRRSSSTASSANSEAARRKSSTTSHDLNDVFQPFQSAPPPTNANHSSVNQDQPPVVAIKSQEKDWRDYFNSAPPAIQKKAAVNSNSKDASKETKQKQVKFEGEPGESSENDEDDVFNVYSQPRDDDRCLIKKPLMPAKYRSKKGLNDDDTDGLAFRIHKTRSWRSRLVKLLCVISVNLALAALITILVYTVGSSNKKTQNSVTPKSVVASLPKESTIIGCNRLQSQLLFERQIQFEASPVDLGFLKFGNKTNAFVLITKGKFRIESIFCTLCKLLSCKFNRQHN